MVERSCGLSRGTGVGLYDGVEGMVGAGLEQFAADDGRPDDCRVAGVLCGEGRGTVEAKWTGKVNLSLCRCLLRWYVLI